MFKPTAMSLVTVTAQLFSGPPQSTVLTWRGHSIFKPRKLHRLTALNLTKVLDSHKLPSSLPDPTTVPC